MDGASPLLWFVLFWVAVVTPAVYLMMIFWHPTPHRPKPEGYIGKFCQPCGQVVHVARMPSGQIWVVSEEKAGVLHRDLGYVTGRELATWTKISTAPDGDYPSPANPPHNSPWEEPSLARMETYLKQHLQPPTSPRPE